MAIVNQAVATPVSGNGTSFSLSHTHPSSLKDGFLLVTVMTRTNPISAPISITSVNWNTSEGMTQLIRRLRNADGLQVAIFGLAAPTAGSFNVTGNFSASSSYIVGAISFSGVVQTGIGAKGGGNGSSTGPSHTLSGTNGSSVIVDAVGFYDLLGSSLTVGAGQTQQWQKGVAFGVKGGTSTEGGGGSVTMSWTLGTSRPWAIAAVELLASGSPRLLSQMGVGR